MTNELNTKHTKLFKALQYLRLQYALNLVEKEIKENQPVAPSQNDGILRSFINAFGNEFKNSKLNKLYNIQKNINAEIARFLNNINGHIYNIREINFVISEIFQNDTYALTKTLFSISLIFDNEYHYEYEKESLNYVSTILWNDEYSLSNIKNKIESMYRDLAKQPLSTNQKFLLGGTAALVLLTATVPALALGGLSASGITGGLAGFGTAIGIGGTMVEGVGLIALTELLLDGAIIGFTYALLDTYNKNIVKKSFREMNYNSTAQMLAIKCYIMNIAKQTMPENVFKEKTSELLQMLQDLKSDTDYMLLVEKQNIEENKKKIKVFHNLDEKLTKILCE